MCQVNPFADEGYPSFFSLERDTGGLAGVNFCSYGTETEYDTTAKMSHAVSSSARQTPSQRWSARPRLG